MFSPHVESNPLPPVACPIGNYQAKYHVENLWSAKP